MKSTSKADRIWSDDGDHIMIQLANEETVVLTVSEILNALASVGAPEMPVKSLRLVS